MIAKPEDGAATTTSTTTAVATQEKPEKSEVAKRVDARVAELRERNALIAAIRGTQWGKDVTRDVAMAVAHYCNTNGLDATRHVEMLGGKIYLTAEFYEERGAPLLLAGEVTKAQPDFINADARLDELAAKGDAWAIEESTRRIRLRIQHGVPEAAAAAVIQKLTLASGTEIIGVNWCGGGIRGKTKWDKEADPIGEAEPSKTAITRAARRAWKQIAEVIPGYGAAVKPIEAAAKIVSEQLPVSVVDKPHETKALAGSGEDPYAPAPVSPQQHADDPTGHVEDVAQDELALEVD